ncbi:hypothetical protein IAT38_000998 [Cryptococcus sp. DSM 104549]
MRFSLASFVLSLAVVVPAVSALQPGDVPINVAVRSEGGEIHHFYEKDAVEYFKKRAEVAEAEIAKRDLEAGELAKRQDVESDLYPVSSEGGKVTAFKGEGSA